MTYFNYTPTEINQLLEDPSLSLLGLEKYINRVILSCCYTFGNFLIIFTYAVN